MDTCKYFILLNINEKDCFFRLDLVRGYCDKKCSLCNKCSSPDIIKIIKPQNADFYEKYIINHQVRVARLCELLSRSLSLISGKIAILIQSALLHDIGKLSISEEVLFQKRKLMPIEFKEIKNHAILGAFCLKGRGFSNDIVHTVKCHHERYDGEGYPDGLKGVEIPYLARILSICDSFDAMTAGRHYKKRFSVSQALKELKENSGTQFDPDVVDKFISILQKREAAKVV